MNTKEIIEAAAGAVLSAVCFLGYIFASRKQKEAPSPKGKKLKKLWFIGLIAGCWFLVGTFITAFSGMSGRLEIEFEMFSERVDIFGLSLAKTTVTTTAVLLCLMVLLLLFRLFAVPKFSAEEPTGIQNIAETAVEFVDTFAENAISGEVYKNIAPFMLSVAMYMLGCEVPELFGVRPPTSELTFTLALGLCTFAMLNIYGLKRNGFVGRLKNMGGSMPAMRPIMIPLKAVSDISVPLSLACRLYGNILGGMLVMELLKGVLGGYASGLPAVAGLWFNLIHPGIQIYIFVTLSLTFINEALE